MNLLTTQFQLSRARLDTASKMIKDATSISSTKTYRVPGIMGNEDLRKYEQMYTAFYAAALNHFLFTNDLEIGTCLHQCPSRANDQGGNPEVSDLAVVGFIEDTFLPGNHVAAWDKKKSDDFERAKQSALYQVNNLDLRWLVFIGMPGTLNVVELQAYFAIHGGIWRMAIGDGPPHDKALLITFFAAVHYLLKNPIRYKKGYIVPIPTRDMNQNLFMLALSVPEFSRPRGKSGNFSTLTKRRYFCIMQTCLRKLASITNWFPWETRKGFSCSPGSISMEPTNQTIWLISEAF